MKEWDNEGVDIQLSTNGEAGADNVNNGNGNIVARALFNEEEYSIYSRLTWDNENDNVLNNNKAYNIPAACPLRY